MWLRTLSLKNYFEINMKVKVTQSCPTLCKPKDYIVHGILQARILEYVTFPFSRESSQPRDQTQVSCTAGGLYQLSHKGSPEINMGPMQSITWILESENLSCLEQERDSDVAALRCESTQKEATRTASQWGNWDLSPTTQGAEVCQHLSETINGFSHRADGKGHSPAST